MATTLLRGLAVLSALFLMVSNAVELAAPKPQCQCSSLGQCRSQLASVVPRCINSCSRSTFPGMSQRSRNKLGMCAARFWRELASLETQCSKTLPGCKNVRKRSVRSGNQHHFMPPGQANRQQPFRFPGQRGDFGQTGSQFGSNFGNNFVGATRPTPSWQTSGFTIRPWLTTASSFNNNNNFGRPFQPNGRPFQQGNNNGFRPNGRPFQQGNNNNNFGFTTRPPWQSGNFRPTTRPPWQQGGNFGGSTRPPFNQGGFTRPPFNQGGFTRPPFNQGGFTRPPSFGSTFRPTFRPGNFQTRPTFRPGNQFTTRRPFGNNNNNNFGRPFPNNNNNFNQFFTTPSNFNNFANQFTPNPFQPNPFRPPPTSSFGQFTPPPPNQGGFNNFQNFLTPPPNQGQSGDLNGFDLFSSLFPPPTKHRHRHKRDVATSGFMGALVTCIVDCGKNATSYQRDIEPAWLHQLNQYLLTDEIGDVPIMDYICAEYQGCDQTYEPRQWFSEACDVSLVQKNFIACMMAPE